MQEKVYYQMETTNTKYKDENIMLDNDDASESGRV